MELGQKMHFSKDSLNHLWILRQDKQYWLDAIKWAPFQREIAPFVLSGPAGLTLLSYGRDRDHHGRDDRLYGPMDGRTPHHAGNQGIFVDTGFEVIYISPIG